MFKINCSLRGGYEETSKVLELGKSRGERELEKKKEGKEKEEKKEGRRKKKKKGQRVKDYYYSSVMDFDDEDMIESYLYCNLIILMSVMR